MLAIFLFIIKFPNKIHKNCVEKNDYLSKLDVEIYVATALIGPPSPGKYYIEKIINHISSLIHTHTLSLLMNSKVRPSLHASLLLNPLSQATLIKE